MSNILKKKLSTLKSIALILTNINSQCGTRVVSGIIGDDVNTIDFTLSSASKVLLTYNDGSYALKELVSSTYTPSSSKSVIQYTIILTADADFLDTVVPLTLGYGLTIKNTNLDICGVLKSSTLWNNDILTDDTWNSKILIARRTIINLVKKDFVLRGINLVVYNLDGKDIMDFITNPDVFLASSDYLTLSLIYSDLSGGGTNQLYLRKALYYMDLYRRLMTTALVLAKVNLDASSTGLPYTNLRMTPTLVW